MNAQNARPEKITEHLKRIERHVSVADGVVTALSNFARMPVPTQLPFSAEACVRDALDTNPLPNSVELQLDFASSLPKALGDASQIRIVFANLIRNARDAMPEGGRLVIRGASVDDGLEISFADNGVGIALEQLARIMEPLYSTKARGLGLGLALCRAILDKHGGQLRVTSKPNEGATFVVCLPVEESLP